MKLTCDKNELARIVGRVQNVVAAKSTLPILANILVETADRQARFVATDLEVGVEENLACEVEKAGGITIPAKRLGEIARELPDGRVKIEASDDGRVTISAGSVTYKIFGMAKDEFPPVPEVQGESEISIPAGELKKMIQKTIFSVSTDVTRYTLNGVYWWMKAGELRLVATDGHRLCMTLHRLKKKREGETGCIVPSKALNEMVRLLEDGVEGDVRIAFAKSHLLAKIGGATLLSRLIEGKFPNYEQGVPKEADPKATASTEK